MFGRKKQKRESAVVMVLDTILDIILIAEILDS